MASASKKVKFVQNDEKSKRKTRYSADYAKEFDFVRKCSSGVQDYEFKYHCVACNMDLSCAHGGRNDIQKHGAGPSHKENYRIMKSE